MKGRCPGSKAMVFAGNGMKSVQVPNVNIGDCDYTIAFWIRLIHSSARAEGTGSPRSGERRQLPSYGMFVSYCRKVSKATEVYITSLKVPGVVVNNWTHIAVTCEQDNGVKIFVNGEIANIKQGLNVRYRYLNLTLGTQLPKEMPVDRHPYSAVIMDLHILGFALPPGEIYDLYRG